MTQTKTKAKTNRAVKEKKPSIKIDDLPLPKADLLRIYRSMVLTRALDERGMMLQRQGRIGFFVPCIGQEAAQVGSAHALTARDWIFPSYRNTGTAIHRGVPMTEIIANLYGNSLDLSKGRQMPNHFSFKSIHFVSISSPIGTQITQAVGAAMAARYRKENMVAITDFGDGATSSNDFHAGLNFAGVFKAPVVFLCQNNQWAISQPLCDQTASPTIAAKAEAYGFPGVRVDGNDVLAVWQAVKEALDRARAGGGPTLVEAVTYRMGPHSSSDNPKAYRKDAEVESWKAKDPIDRFRRTLGDAGILSEADDKTLWEAARQEIVQAVKTVEAGPALPVETLFEDVYVAMPKHLAEQQQALRREIEERGGIRHGDGAFPL